MFVTLRGEAYLLWHTVNEHDAESRKRLDRALRACAILAAIGDVSESVQTEGAMCAFGTSLVGIRNYL
jgi:hypothetical protein